MADYPQSTLLDIYKFFFQGAFGPGHMINDQEAVYQYQEYELANSTEFDTLLWQPLGNNGQYYRLNLVLVKEGKIPPQAYFDAFIESANAAPPPSQQVWQKEWAEILSVVEDMNLDLPAFQSDKAQLDKMLSEGGFIGHHSETYRKLYHPHYRVISKAQFENLKKQYLN